jgi:hypothetical protein
MTALFAIRLLSVWNQYIDHKNFDPGYCQPTPQALPTNPFKPTPINEPFNFNSFF